MFKKIYLRKIIGIKIPMVLIIPIMGISILLIDCFDIFGHKRYPVPKNIDTTSGNSTQQSKRKEHRLTLSDGRLVYPILFNDRSEEASAYASLKSSINSVYTDYQSRGVLLDAAVYFFDFSSLEWFGINAEQLFTPGSLMKIATSITVMKRAEQNPNFLNQRITFTEADNLHVEQTLSDEILQPGKSYSVKDLLVSMLRHSDNNATFLLNKTCGIDALRKTYNDFDITMPQDASYQITIHQYVRFFKALFYATYLSQENSEYLMNQLANSGFKNGLEKGKNQQSNLVIAHKFGERDYNGTSELHDVGIVYKNGGAYLVGIMAKGNNRVDLEQFIGQISTTLTSSL
jgi:beta-lactamase class A